MQNNNNGSQSNILVAMGLTMAILVGWSFFFDKPAETPETSPESALQGPSLQNNGQSPQIQGQNTESSHVDAAKPVIDSGSAPVLAQNNEQTTVNSPRIHIKTDKLKGSIRLQGARFDELVLTDYNESVDGTGKDIALLTNDNTNEAYFAEFGWLGQNQNGQSLAALPDAKTNWSVSGNDTLTSSTPVTLTYTSPDGLQFTRTISVDDNYVFSLEDKVTNTSSMAVNIYSYGMITRNLPKDVSSFFILHEGPIGYLGDKLVETKYEDIQDKSESYQSTGGWAGLTDKYWLTALIPDQSKDIKVTYRASQHQGTKRFFTDFVGPARALSPGETVSATNHFFAGAKVLDLLDHYESKLGIKHFDLAVDFGWFYFLTKPMFHVLNMAKDFLGNFGLAILLLTVVLKLLFFPLANKSYRSMARMKQLQPKMKKIKEDHGDDRMAMNQAMMELYKKEKVNPMAGCLPMIIQIPVFFALYKVLFVSIEMRHAPFYGWIHDLSAPDPTSVFNLFGLIPFDVPSFLQIGAWPLIMGATMIVQQRLNPTPQDPVQEKMFMLMPIIFTVMLANFPAGLVIYWAWNNLLTIIQQWAIMRMESKRVN